MNLKILPIYAQSRDIHANISNILQTPPNTANPKSVRESLRSSVQSTENSKSTGEVTGELETIPDTINESDTSPQVLPGWGNEEDDMLSSDVFDKSSTSSEPHVNQEVNQILDVVNVGCTEIKKRVVTPQEVPTPTNRVYISRCHAVIKAGKQEEITQGVRLIPRLTHDYIDNVTFVLYCVCSKEETKQWGRR